MSVLRTAAERLSRGLVIKRRLPAEFGRRAVYVSPDAALRYWRLDSKVFDPTLLRFCATFVGPGEIVFDIGANVGLFAFAAAQRAGSAGRIVAVEADAWLASILQRSAAKPLPDEAPATVVCAAVANTTGLLSFSIAARGRASNFLTQVGGNTQTGGARQTTVVAATTIDSLAEHFGSPDVLKIDVEGAEALVLEGAPTVLARSRPIILCEVEARSTDSVLHALISNEYVLFDGEGGVDAYPRSQSPTFSTIACPREKVSRYRALKG